MIHAIPSTRANFDKIIDKYGDSYTKSVDNIDALKELLASVRIESSDLNAYKLVERELGIENISVDEFYSIEPDFESGELWDEFKQLFNQSRLRI